MSLAAHASHAPELSTSSSLRGCRAADFSAVIDHNAGGWVQQSAVHHAAAACRSCRRPHRVSFAGLEEPDVRGNDLRALRGDFAQRRHLIHHPESAAMRSDGQIVTVNQDVANRSNRHVVLQRLPVVAVVERDIDAQFGGGVQQPLRFRVFLDRID